MSYLYASRIPPTFDAKPTTAKFKTTLGLFVGRMLMFPVDDAGVLSQNLNSDVLMMESAEDWY
jgi:hypothetical protein